MNLSHLCSLNIHNSWPTQKAAKDKGLNVYIIDYINKDYSGTISGSWHKYASAKWLYIFFAFWI